MIGLSQRWLRQWEALLLILLACLLIEQTMGKFSHLQNKNFAGSIPESVSEAVEQLSKIVPPLLGSAPFNPSHPLDPLSALEIRTAALIIRAANRSSNLEFKCIGLQEPKKSVLVQHFLSATSPPLGSIPRRASVLVVDAASKAPAQVIVNLRSLKVESWSDAGSAQSAASITGDDQSVARKVALSDPGVVARLNELGFNDLNSIMTDVLEAGYVADNPEYKDVRKLVQIFLYAYLGTGDNYYAHPLDFVVYVDLVAKVVRGIESLPIQNDFSVSNRTGASVPQASATYFHDSPSLTHPIRDDVRPIAISRPEGTSFQVQDRIVTWQNFRFHVGYSPREGLLINHVTYNDSGKARPLFYRISLSEAFIYFADSRPPYHRKSSFDEGNFKFGTSAQSLSPEFCRGQAYYFDSLIHNDTAATLLVENSTCIFEEDAGILWAHYDAASDRTAVTRSQRLSVSSFINIGSCDYFLSWRFYQDATVELSVLLTGIQNTNLMAVDVKGHIFGNLMSPQVYTQNFQFFLAARVDADIDGVKNTVAMENIVSSHENPYGNGIELKSKVLTQVQDAPEDIAPGRTWRVVNTNQPANNVTGKPPSWKLIPQGPHMPNLLTHNGPLRKRLSFADHSMWVLPFDDNQIFVDGLYLDGGVSQWTNESLSANLVNTDVVLWHVFGTVYTPDVEDWPVLSALPDTVGFKLRPSNFFLQNPATTVPPASQTTAHDQNNGEAQAINISI